MDVTLGVMMARAMALLAFLAALFGFLRQTGLLDDWRNRNKKEKPVKKKAPEVYDHEWEDDE